MIEIISNVFAQFLSIVHDVLTYPVAQLTELSSTIL